ncbi:MULTISPECIES: hypothetical protein [unclassified Gilliamella]|uniref:hypothetical protein n=1 Tax=unclassified Gilliamella TaxID=2685620 RepID=UPI000A351D6D|nr:MULTISPECIES: hypothetical protein [unclassified Gilliamella]OTQ74740.1 hypothetical protein B6C99_03005 [Gilliamella sp. N-G2]OTQ79440.1 hypothetical protein B6D23_05250 [Gilliamella sp. N-W3]
MNIDSSVYDITIEFGGLNCGDTFIHLTDLYMKVVTLHDGTTGFLAVRLFDGDTRYLVDVEIVKLVKTKAVRDNG